MKSVIPGANVKVFGRAIHSLSKVGEELYIEALEHGLALRTVNSSRSAYACYIFAPSFFLYYNDDVSDGASTGSEGEVLKYKINMKSCLTVFKSLSTLEKTVDKCKIKLDLKEARLIFQLYCRHGIVKTHNLSFIECETLQAVFSKDMCPNMLSAQTKLLCEAVLNFQTNQEEVSLTVDPLKVKLKNYTGEETDPQKVMNTEVSLEPDEFESYQVGVDTCITFCLKELRAILAFSEPTNLPISLHFETPGKPVVLSMDTDPSFEANFVLATLTDKDSALSSSQLTHLATDATQRITNTTHSFLDTQSGIEPKLIVKASSAAKADIDCENEFPSNSRKKHMGQACLSSGDFAKRKNKEPVFPDHDHSFMTTVPSHITNQGVGDSTLGLPEIPRMFQGQGEDDDDDCDDMPCSPIIPVQYSKLKGNQRSTTASVLPDKSESENEPTEKEELVPGTPPRKRMKSLFGGLSQSMAMSVQSQEVTILAENTDDED